MQLGNFSHSEYKMMKRTAAKGEASRNTSVEKTGGEKFIKWKKEKIGKDSKGSVFFY